MLTDHQHMAAIYKAYRQTKHQQCSTLAPSYMGRRVMQQRAKPNAKALQALEAAFRAYGREEGRGPFELKTQKVAANDEAATLDLVQQTAEALTSAEQRIEELQTLQEELFRVTRARMERAQAAIDAAERRAGEAERLANDAEEKARKSRECLTWGREAGSRALLKAAGPASRTLRARADSTQVLGGTFPNR